MAVADFSDSPSVAIDKVLAIIVSYEDQDWLADCLYSLSQSSYPVDVVLVDNGYTELAAEFVHSTFPDVKVISNQVNNGFSGGCNQGLIWGLKNDYKYFFLVNPDTRCPSDLVSRMIVFLNDYANYGIVGPLQRQYKLGTAKASEELNSWTVRALADPHVSYFARWIPRLRPVQARENLVPGVIDRSYVQGSALFMRREVCEKVGLLDERYHTFHEEVDFCRRAWWSGFRVGLLTNLWIEHCARDLTQITWYRVFHRTKNRYYFIFTEPSLSLREICTLALRWLGADIRMAATSGPAAGKRFAAISASLVWLVRNVVEVRQARAVRVAAYHAAE